MYRVFRYKGYPTYWPATATIYVDLPSGAVEQYVTDNNGVQKLVSGGGGGGSVDWSTITSTPTTLAGYGITDAQTSSVSLTNLLATTGTGILVRTGVNTWALDGHTYLTSTQVLTLTGDTTGSGLVTGSITTTIASNVVTTDKLQKINSSTFLARKSGGLGNVEILNVSDVKSILSLLGSNSGDVTLLGENYLGLVGQVLTANPINLGSSNVTGLLPAAMVNGGASDANAIAYAIALG